MCGPQMWLCLFMFRPIASNQLKKLDFNRYFQFTPWCSDNASALVRVVSYSISGSGKGFYV